MKKKPCCIFTYTIFVCFAGIDVGEFFLVVHSTGIWFKKGKINVWIIKHYSFSCFISQVLWISRFHFLPSTMMDRVGSFTQRMGRSSNVRTVWPTLGSRATPLHLSTISFKIANNSSQTLTFVWLRCRFVLSILCVNPPRIVLCSLFFVLTPFVWCGCCHSQMQEREDYMPSHLVSHVN